MGKLQKTNKEVVFLECVLRCTRTIERISEFHMDKEGKIGGKAKEYCEDALKDVEFIKEYIGDK